jgi:hypothetical protein
MHLFHHANQNGLAKGFTFIGRCGAKYTIAPTKYYADSTTTIHANLRLSSCPNGSRLWQTE